MHRPATYSTKQGDAVLACLVSAKNTFVTVAQIADHLQKEHTSVSRPTIYRRLEKLVCDGRVSKYSFGDSSVTSYRYNDPGKYDRDTYHLKCEICNEITDLKCDEVDHVSRHIFKDHAFQVNDSKTVFYGKCEKCLK
ncbi:MAG: transcriptional repressor [Oscillospiraceae bacterium]|nr:transcriptional repressor [Oscillospiraceae bacterium]